MATMKDSPRQIEVLLPKPFAHGFDYAVADDLKISQGAWVKVPFGKQALFGVAWGAGRQEIDPQKLKPIAGTVDELPLLSDAFRGFIDWVSAYTLAPKGMVLKMVMPVAEAFAPPALPAHYVLGKPPAKRTPQRENVLSLLADGTPRTVAQLAEAAGVSDAVVRALVKQGALVEAEPETAKPSLPVIPEGSSLSPQQQAAADALIRKLGGGFATTLIDGVTGSGKTEVYFEVIEKLLKQDTASQALVLLPEIALSVQWVKRFETRFGFAPTVWHSGLTPAQRRNAWRDIATGQARLVVGARSALFLPYPHLKLLVVDEEHEPSYKQEDGVIYQARDMAVARGFHEKIPVVLVSATPSLETQQNVKSGKYDVLQLPSRYSGVSLPEVGLVDMRAEKMDSGTWLSPDVRQALADTLNAGKQALLFLNRRGYAPLLLCRGCGHRFACPDCSSWLVLHQQAGSTPGEIKGRLTCHHCGYHERVPETCPACEAEAKLVPCGPGVERVTEEARHLFPHARIVTMASDTTTSLADAQTTVDAMTRGEVDILVGTQMVAKGYHFPALHLIGVVDADLGLSGGDLRAVERTYQLLHQVAGRAGREGDKGRVLLQTYVPEHPVMLALAHWDRAGLEEMELQGREEAGLPPFGRLAAVIVDGASETQVIRACRELAHRFPNREDIRVLGPAPAPLARLRGRFRYRFLIKAPRHFSLQHYLLPLVPPARHKSAVRIRIDIDPYNFV